MISLTCLLLFFQAKGRIVVMPGNVFLSSLPGLAIPSLSLLASCPGIPSLIWLSEPAAQEEQLLSW